MSTSNQHSRRQARELCLQFLFRFTFSRDEMSGDGSINNKAHSESELTSEIERFLTDLDIKPETQLVSYIQGRVSTCLAHFNKITEKIVQNLKNWKLERVSAIDRALLFLAYTENQLIDEVVPKQVVINEFIELSKAFSHEKSPKFINGILEQLLQ